MGHLRTVGALTYAVLAAALFAPAAVAATTVSGASGASTVSAHSLATSAPAAAWSLATEDDATRFQVGYQVNQNGSVDVTENIEWAFPSGVEKHGIYRDITVRSGYQNRTDQYRYYALSQVSVTSSTGAPTDISITDQGATARLRIGSPSQTVTGTQDYAVHYHLDHVVNDIGDGTAEFYYNLVDPINATAMNGVSASVTGPAAATKAACYYGPSGSTRSCTATPGGTSTFAVPDLSAGEGASVVTSYPRTAFGDLTPDVRQGSATTTSGSTLSPTTARQLGGLLIGLGVLVPALAVALMGMLVWRRGRDEQYAGLTPGLSPGMGQQIPVVRSSHEPTVAVQFTPPDGVQPGMLGTIIDEDAGIVDVTATLVDLAVRGYLVLEEVPGEHAWSRADWQLTRTSPPAGAAALNPYEQTLVDSVFAGAGQVRLSALKNTFAPTLKIVQRLMYEETVQRGWFRQSPDVQRGVWVRTGLVLAVVSVLGAFALTSALGGAFQDANLPVPPLLVLGGGGLVAGLVMASLGKRMASRTAQGSAILAQSRGFRQYLVTAEANQIRWEEAQDIFSRYLPYAIVFGIAERWAAVFQQVADAAAAAGHTIAAPVWYVGPWSTGGFGGLAAGMDSFSTTAAGTFVSTPGSSGSSGFGGGGFSGGGGGGSSGGSW